jgi:hypothetical protein
MPLAVYVALQSDLDAAVALSVLLLVMAFGLLLGLRAAPVGSFWGHRPCSSCGSLAGSARSSSRPNSRWPSAR